MPKILKYRAITMRERHQPSQDTFFNLNMVGIAQGEEEYMAGRCFVRFGHHRYSAMAVCTRDERRITTDQHAPTVLASWGLAFGAAERLVSRAIREGRGEE